MFNKLIRAEGAAARYFGNPVNDNPYTLLARETGESIWTDLAAEWRIGWITENKPIKRD